MVINSAITFDLIRITVEEPAKYEAEMIRTFSQTLEGLARIVLSVRGARGSAVRFYAQLGNITLHFVDYCAKLHCL
jgi:hypothetical protein